MKEEFFWPIIGIFLGWFLASLATGWQSRETIRKGVGKVIYKLIIMENQMTVTRITLEKIKDNVKNCSEYEGFRRSIMDRHFLEPASNFEFLKNAIDEISGTYPIESIDLRWLVDNLYKAKNAKLSVSLGTDELYIRMLSTLEVSMLQYEKFLTKYIVKLAFKHSAMTVLKVYLRRFIIKFRRKKNIKINEFLDETFSLYQDEIERHQQKNGHPSSS